MYSLQCPGIGCPNIVYIVPILTVALWVCKDFAKEVIVTHDHTLISFLVPSPEDLEDEAIHQQPKSNYESVDKTEVRRDKSPIVLGPGPGKEPIVLGAPSSDKEPIISVQVDENDINSS